MHAEIGGYLEMEVYSGKEYYPDAIGLNCGRNAIAYIIEANKYKRVYVPLFSCTAVKNGVEKAGAECVFYRIDEKFRPVIGFSLNQDDAILIINYYGVISNKEIKEYKKVFHNIIVDNTQAFFQSPVKNVDTTYTCRKYFGVSDGAYVYSNKKIARNLSYDSSLDKIKFVLGRYEKDANSYYKDASDNNAIFDKEPVLLMSKITKNILCSLNYKKIKKIRTENFKYLHRALKQDNKIRDICSKSPYMYPFYIENGHNLRKYLQQNKIYVPCLWPNVLDVADKNSIEYKYANDIVLFPCDQRYTLEDMNNMVNRYLIWNEKLKLNEF